MRPNTQMKKENVVNSIHFCFVPRIYTEYRKYTVYILPEYILCSGNKKTFGFLHMHQLQMNIPGGNHFTLKGCSIPSQLPRKANNPYIHKSHITYLSGLSQIFYNIDSLSPWLTFLKCFYIQLNNCNQFSSKELYIFTLIRVKEKEILNYLHINQLIPKSELLAQKSNR